MTSTTPSYIDPTPPPKPLKRRRKLWVTLSTLTLVAIVYIIGAINFALDKPAITRNYYTELNARHADYPPEDKAFGVYLAVRAQWHPVSHELSDRAEQWLDNERDRLFQIDNLADPVPSPFKSDRNPWGIPVGHPLYPDAVTAIESAAPLIDRLREAAARPVHGATVTDTIMSDNFEVADDYLDPNPDPTKTMPLFVTLMPHLGPMRGGAKLLAADAYLAAAESDSDRFVEDIKAILGIARHAEECYMLIGDLVAISIVHLATEATVRVLYEQPGLLTAPQLRRLQAALETDGIKAASVNFADERLMHDDLVQRIYTEDQSGDGHITLDGIQLTGQLSRQPAPPRVLNIALWPIRYKIVSRSTQVAHVDMLFDNAHALLDRGPGFAPTYAAQEQELIATEEQPLTIALKSSILAPTFHKAAFTQFNMRAELRATITRIALERHRLDHNTYPADLTDLVPAYLDEVPPDPFDPGQPLKYRLIDNTPHLYYAGADGDDDGGTRPPPERENDEHKFDLRYTASGSPSPDAPDADWVITPPQPD